MKLKSNLETITAVSTPIGEGGIGIVRLSGSKALAIADRVFRSKQIKPSEQKPFTSQYGWIIQEGGSAPRVIDDVLLHVMRSPKSYTREDMVEIHCHGGRMVVQKILDLCVRHGARLAQPGEFTKRAFLNGRIDLTQAEAVLDLIRAQSDRAYEAARRQMEGSLFRIANALKDELVQLLSHVEAAIDFPDDYLKPENTEELKTRLSGILGRLESLCDQSRQGQVLREGLMTVLAGRPNVGKSSLMNALLGQDRMIVSDTPGTTRDSVEEMIHLNGCPVRLIDTAGLGLGHNSLDLASMEKTRTQMDRASLVLFVVDVTAPLSREEQVTWEKWSHKPRFLIMNKTDIAFSDYRAYGTDLKDATNVFETSCVTQTGLSTLKDELFAFASKEAPPASEEEWLFSLRHEEAFRRAGQALHRAHVALDKGLSPEFAATDIRHALDDIGEIIGEVATDDILDRVFSQFCIGK